MSKMTGSPALTTGSDSINSSPALPGTWMSARRTSYSFVRNASMASATEPTASQSKPARVSRLAQALAELFVVDGKQDFARRRLRGLIGLVHYFHGVNYFARADSHNTRLTASANLSWFSGLFKTSRMPTACNSACVIALVMPDAKRIGKSGRN